MNNADMSAMPFYDELYSDEGFEMTIDSSPGLSKREHFSVMAMQGVLSADFENELTPDDVAITARQCADALLKELEK